MFETFYPGNYVDSAYEITYEKLYERGYRGIIFDVDIGEYSMPNGYMAASIRAVKRVNMLLKLCAHISS